MLSIAAILNSDASSSERLRQANSCYQRAQALLDLRILHSRSVLAVQCFLLLASYLQSTNDSQQCWVYVGQAIRLAQSLELDRPGTSANAASPQLRENFRRVWYGCVFMDRMLSLAFGRRPALSFNGSNNVPLPLAHASGICRCFTTMPTDVPDAQEIHFFVESIKYYELISQTLQALYSATTEVGDSDDLYTIFFGAPGPKTVGYLAEIDYKLRRWRQALPFQLGQDTTARKSEMHVRQGERSLDTRPLHPYSHAATDSSPILCKRMRICRCPQGDNALATSSSILDSVYQDSVGSRRLLQLGHRFSDAEKPGRYRSSVVGTVSSTCTQQRASWSQRGYRQRFSKLSRRPPCLRPGRA